MRIFLLTLCAAALPLCAALPEPVPDLNDPKQGQELAAGVRERAPDEDSQFEGQLRLRGRSEGNRTIPLRSSVRLGQGSWTNIYETLGAKDGGTRLVIVHQDEAPTRFYLSEAGAPLRAVNGAELNRSFAGSDFSLLDLGLDFFHWPRQMLIRKEMRKGRPVRLLESSPAVTNEYGRVLSWVDAETDALLIAEAIDLSGRTLKEFEVKKVVKVNGRWQLRALEIRNRITGTSTRLEIDLP